MKSLASFPRILFHRAHVDFRKRRMGLAALIDSALGENPFEGTLFLFVNRRRDCIRALYWDRTGFAMWEKALEKQHFPLPKKPDRTGCVTLESRQVEWLLDGVDIWRLSPHETLSYKRLR